MGTAEAPNGWNAQWFYGKSKLANERQHAALIAQREWIDGAKPPAIEIGEQEIEARLKREIDERHGGKRDEFQRFLRAHRTTLKAFRKFMHDDLLEQAIRRRQELGK